MAAAASIPARAGRLARRTPVILAAVVAPLAFGAIYLLQTRIEPLRPEVTNSAAGSLPSAGTVRRLSLGYSGLAADLYWTRAIQYFGSRHGQPDASYPLLVPMLNLTYELDPDLSAPVEYGSFFLADVKPLGAGEPQAAVALLERAITRHPNYWRFYFDLGFIYALNLHDRARAAQAFYRGAQRPGAHPVLKTLAAAYMGVVNERALARTLWNDLAQNSPDKMVRANARDHLAALRVHDDLDQLGTIAREFVWRFGRPPANWRELVDAGYLRGIPADPQGRPYHLLPGGQFAVDAETKIRSLSEKLPG